jgi:hypothetical protein
VGKTSLVAHLAALTGHACVRVNNHEHTDIQAGLAIKNPPEKNPKNPLKMFFF